MVSGQKYLLVLIIFVFVTNLAASNAGLVENDTLHQNTRENRQLKRDAQKEELRKSHNRFIFTTVYVYARLITEASFELPGGWLTAKVSLEGKSGSSRQERVLYRRVYLQGIATQRALPAPLWYQPEQNISDKQGPATSLPT
jgi:hypothetical protein